MLVMDRMASAARAGEHAQREQDESHRANRSSAMHNESVRDARAAQQSAEHAMAWMNHNRSHLPSLPPAQLPPPAMQPHPAPPQAAPNMNSALLLSVVQELASLKALMTTPVAEEQ